MKFLCESICWILYFGSLAIYPNLTASAIQPPPQPDEKSALTSPSRPQQKPQIPTRPIGKISKNAHPIPPTQKTIPVLSKLNSKAVTQKQTPHPEIKPRVLLGIDILEQQLHFQPLFFDGAKKKKPKRVGLVCNIASINGKGVPTAQVLKQAPGVKLVALFIPENGFNGDLRNGKAIPQSTHGPTGLPIYAMYGNGKMHLPNPKTLEKIDVLVFDLQDIGCRSFTYITTLRCVPSRIEVIVLDRPNPLGGIQIDGPVIKDDKYMSYIGGFRIPYIHGLTIGEIAQLTKIDSGHPFLKKFPDFNAKKRKLTVIPMQGWQRWMLWKDTGLRWIPPSNLIYSPETAAMYSIIGLGCVGNYFSHGVGTPYPFQCLNWARNPHPPLGKLFQSLQASRIPYLSFKETPQGVLVKLNNWNKVRPMELSLHLLQLTKIYSPHNPFTAKATNKKSYTGRVIGSEEFLKELASSKKTIRIDYFLKKWRLDCLNFQEYIKKNHCLLY